jgi:hypothetical protein
LERSATAPPCQKRPLRGNFRSEPEPSREYRFKANLKTAFTDLARVTEMSASFDCDLVSVTRKPSKAQRKHLARKTQGNGQNRLGIRATRPAQKAVFLLLFTKCYVSADFQLIIF